MVKLVILILSLHPDDTFFIKSVSPYLSTMKFGHYRDYQILSQPFVIAKSSVVHVLELSGVNFNDIISHCSL